jgi:hypothetical protein
MSEATARSLKAIELADVLSFAGADADDAERLDEDGWANAVAVAAARRSRRMGLPSDETRRLVISLMRVRAQA